SRSDDIIQAVVAIGRSPRHYLFATEQEVPLHKASRVTGPEVLKSFRTGRIRTETSCPTRLPAALGGRLPARLTVRRRQNSLDILEHRQIKACLKSWAAWLSGIAEVLAKSGRDEDGDLQTTAGHWATRVRRIARQFNEAAESGFLKEVGDAPAVLQMTSLFRSDPVYHRFY